MNSMRHLVLGAARSGKTRFALNVAKSLASTLEREVIYVATAEAHDAEMRERIARHRAERPTNWRTLEAPRDLARALATIASRAPTEARASSEVHASTEARASSETQTSSDTRASTEARAPNDARTTPPAPVIVLDCLTLWLSNALLSDFNEDDPAAPLPTWTRERESFMHWLKNTHHPLILVSNEVGGGIVPASALARRFQSEQGWLNQDVASVCEQVTLVVAGLPVPIKSP